MSLGFARDSILDLATMAKEHEEAEGKTSSSGSNDELSSQSSLNDSDQQPIALTQKKNVYLQQQQQAPSQAASEHVGLVLGGPPSQRGSGGRPHRAGSGTSAASSNAGSSTAGQSSSSSVGGSGVQNKGAYSAFAYDYSAYADYYEEADAWMQGGGGAGGGNTKKSNVFCCLFPWTSQAESEDEDSDDDSTSIGGDDEEDVNAAEVGAERSSAKLEEEDEEYRVPLEVNDSVALAKAKQLGLVSASDTEGAPSDEALSVAEEKKGEEEDFGGDSAAVSTVSTGLKDDAKIASVAAAAAQTAAPSDEDDVTSHASVASGDTDVYGEKLTEKDRQAVMARLRLSMSESEPKAAPPPEVSTSGSESGAPSASSPQPSAKKVKGILKRTSNMGSHESVASAARDAQNKKDQSGSPNKRTLFPLYSPRRIHPAPGAAAHDGLLSPPSQKSVGFSPMARVVSVPGRQDMSFVDKAGVWWQRSDYDDFKKTGRIIAKAMLQGGSEIWLSSNNAWERRAQQNKSKKTNGSDEYDQALRQYVGEQDAGLDPAEEPGDYGSKWWCKFGHSRRGLEHIASMEEGRHRQRNVNSAIRHILDEQRSQRLNHKRDPVKLAQVALQYTSWARDLALAAGASDAEAVRTNFCRNAKDRGHYLRVGTAAANNTGESTVASGHSRVASDVHRIAPEILDANTSTHIYLERKDAKEAAAAAAAEAEAKKEKLLEPPTPTEDVVKKPVSEDIEEGYTTPDEGFVDLEAIHDPDASHDAIAKQAAGFNQHSDDGVDMSAVIAGMGPVHKKQEAVGAH